VRAVHLGGRPARIGSEVVVVKSGGASRTAVFVCQGRAVAQGRLAVGRFSDPVAELVLRPDELAPVRSARGEAAEPAGGRQRLALEAVRACAEVVVPRTVVIDDTVTGAVQRDGQTQVVVLGAGLDTRAWRLLALSTATVFCVDHPASQADAQTRTAALIPVARRLVLVPADLSTQSLDRALAQAGHDASTPTVWVWEGVVPYLRRADVEATATALTGRSARGSLLVVNYQAPSLSAAFGRRAATLVAHLVGADAVTSDEPWRSTWTAGAMARLLTRRSWVVQQDVNLLDVAEQLGSPTRHARSLRGGRVAVARFDGPARQGT
jgi:methyltransferase (TIGR00027 family)